MNKNELKDVLKQHGLWLRCFGSEGRQANLQGANLQGANLRGADLRCADLRGANLRRADLRRADLQDADLRGADLQDADLQGANLQGADLRRANLDYSCLPLWCGSLSAHFDDRQIIQFIYHATQAGISSKNTSEDIKAELKRLIPLANKFHRVSECGFIEEA